MAYSPHTTQHGRRCTHRAGEKLSPDSSCLHWKSLYVRAKARGEMVSDALPVPGAVAAYTYPPSWAIHTLQSQKEI